MGRPEILPELHRRAGARFTEIAGAAIPADFGDADAEYAALRRGAGLLDLSFRAKLRLRGAARARFLHNMLTNDILSLQPGRGCHALKLSVQGRMEAALRVLCLDQELWCDLEPAPAEALLAGLRRRIILEDARIEDVGATWALLSLQGPAAAHVLGRLGLDTQLPEEAHAHIETSLAGIAVRLVRSDHTGDGGFDIWTPVAAAVQVWEALLGLGEPVRRAGLAALDVCRIEAGIPWHGSEISTERFPQEAGLEAGWISYTKGCYLGQETVARLHHMGHVNWLLRGLLLRGGGGSTQGEAAQSEAMQSEATQGEITQGGPTQGGRSQARSTSGVSSPAGRLPDAGAKLLHERREAGQLTSIVRSPRLGCPAGLAYVRREFAAPGTRLVVSSAPASWFAEVCTLPLHSADPAG